MFSVCDLLIGAAGIRLMRKYKKVRNIPDIVYVKKNLAFGGITSYEELKKIGINSVLDLRVERPNEIIDDIKLEYMKIGIPDGSIPNELQINQIYKIVKEEKEGKTVFIHCNLGRGRATLVTLLYLLKDGVSWEMALKKIKKRKFVYLNKKQLEFLKKIYDR